MREKHSCRNVLKLYKRYLLEVWSFVTFRGFEVTDVSKIIMCQNLQISQLKITQFLRNFVPSIKEQDITEHCSKLIEEWYMSLSMAVTTVTFTVKTGVLEIKHLQTVNWKAVEAVPYCGAVCFSILPSL